MAQQEFVTMPSNAYTILYPERQYRKGCPHRRDVACNCANIVEYPPCNFTAITQEENSSPTVYTYSQNPNTSFSPLRTIRTLESSNIRYIVKDKHRYSHYRSPKVYHTSNTSQRVKYREISYSNDSDRSSDEPYRSRQSSPYRSQDPSPEIKEDRQYKRSRSHRTGSHDDSNVVQSRHRAENYSHEPRRSSEIITSQCTHTKVEGLMAGGLHPDDRVSDRRRRHAGLVQDDFGIWHECNETKKKRDTRRVHWPDESEDGLEIEESPHRRKGRHHRSGRSDP